jgi:hypothetical protein
VLDRRLPPGDDVFVQPTAPEVPRVEGDVRCVECEYNLIGQKQEGRCPECGYSVDESIRAARLWSVARVRRLRLACLLFACSVPPWLFLSIVLKAFAPSRGLSLVLAAAIVAHLILVVWSAFSGLRASSWQPQRRRTILLAIGSVAIASAAMLPLASITRAVALTTTTLMPSLIAAAALRVLFVLAAGWWIATGVATLRPLWVGPNLWIRAALVLMALAWVPFGFFFSMSQLNFVWFGLSRLEALGFLALWIECGGALLISGIAVALRVSLGSQPRRIGFASEG